MASYLSPSALASCLPSRPAIDAWSVGPGLDTGSKPQLWAAPCTVYVTWVSPVLRCPEAKKAPFPLSWPPAQSENQPSLCGQ